MPPLCFSVTAVLGYGQPGHPRCSNVSVPHSRGRASLHVPPLCFSVTAVPGYGQPGQPWCSNVAVFQLQQDCTWQCQAQSMLQCFSRSRTAPGSARLTACVSVTLLQQPLHLAAPVSVHVSVFQPLQTALGSPMLSVGFSRCGTALGELLCTARSTQLVLAHRRQLSVPAHLETFDPGHVTCYSGDEVTTYPPDCLGTVRAHPSVASSTYLRGNIIQAVATGRWLTASLH